MNNCIESLSASPGEFLGNSSTGLLPASYNYKQTGVYLKTIQRETNHSITVTLDPSRITTFVSN